MKCVTNSRADGYRVGGAKGRTMPSPDCYCSNGTLCPPCIVSAAIMLHHDHPDSLSVSLLRRRIHGITGHEAMLLVEMSKALPSVSRAHAANRNGGD